MLDELAVCVVLQMMIPMQQMVWNSSNPAAACFSDTAGKMIGSTNFSDQVIDGNGFCIIRHSLPK